jgi:hypothetical protein
MQKSSPDEEKGFKVPVWVKAFVLWHIYAMTAWSLPRPAPALINGQIGPSLSNIVSDPLAFGLLVNYRIKNEPWSPLFWYMQPTGLWQYWDMFAPNPSSMDVWLDAVIVLQDGSKVTRTYPRMALLSIPEKYVSERYRKYVERVNPDVHSWKRPELAQWMALQAATDPGNPPIQVELRRHFRIIQPYGRPTAEEDTTESMGFFQVDLAKLKRDKGW